MGRAESQSPQVSVIVPVLGDGPHLDACVTALLEQQSTVGAAEVVVVDNGSYPPVRNRWGGSCVVVREESPGSYAARNAGIRVSTGRVLAFTDADCVPHLTWLSAGLAAMGERNDVVVAGAVQVTTSNEPPIAELYERRYAFPIAHYVQQGFSVTANLLVSRSLIDDLGGFDSTLTSGGDRDLCLRARASGATVLFAESAVVDHPARSSLGELVSKQRRVTRGAVVLMRRDGATRGELIRSGLWKLRPPLRAMWRTPSAPEERLRDRVGVTLMAWLLSAVSSVELLAEATRPGLRKSR